MSSNSTATATSDAAVIFAECGLHLTPLLLILIPAAVDIVILFMLSSSVNLRWFHWPLIGKQLVGACLSCAAVVRFWLLGATRLSFFACSAVLDLEVSPVLKLFAVLQMVSRLTEAGIYSGARPPCLQLLGHLLFMSIVVFSIVVLSVQWLIGVLSFLIAGLPFLWIPLAAITILSTLLGRALSIQDSQRAREQANEKDKEKERKASVQMVKDDSSTELATNTVPTVSDDDVAVVVAALPAASTLPVSLSPSVTSSPSSASLSQGMQSFKMCGYWLYALSFSSLMGMSYFGFMLEQQSYTASMAMLWEQRPTLREYSLRQWQEIIRWL